MMRATKTRPVRPRCAAGVACAAALLAVAAAAAAKDNPKSGAPAGFYEAQHGAWAVSCNPCTGGEDNLCQIWPESVDGSVALYPVDYDAEKPALAMSYYPRELAFETEGTLTVAVDGEEVRVITSPDVIYMAMYGDLYVEEEEVSALVPALREGTLVTLDFVDPDGGGPQQFPLDGFGAALDDMLRHLPEAAAAMDPDSCSY
jgi:invasion protein IalB